MDEKQITCIICPSSCRITVKAEGGEIKSVEGYTCKRGLEYAQSEYLHPERKLTSTVKAAGYKAPVISVRTSKPIPKDMQMACMKVIQGLTVEAPFEIGRVVMSNILNTGADLILTNN